MVVAACLFVLSYILPAGLWPLIPFVTNEVSWVENAESLRLGEHSTMRSESSFEWKPSGDPEYCSLEVLLESDRTDTSRVILAFSTPDNPMQFRLAQSGDGLVVTRDLPGAQSRLTSVRLVVDSVFREGEAVLVSVTAGPDGTAIYLNGALAKLSPQFGLSARDFTGSLLISSSPVAHGGWSGVLSGLAVYDRTISADEVLRNYHSWNTRKRPEDFPERGLVALYTFNERAGRVVHNQIAWGPDLYIPERFWVEHAVFLQPFWKEFDLRRGYLRDVFLNVAGFVPFGVAFCAYFSLRRKVNRALVITIVVGALLSLTIEFLQLYIPARSSSSTDLIMNTLGTAVGALAYRSLSPYLWPVRVESRAFWDDSPAALGPDI